MVILRRLSQPILRTSKKSSGVLGYPDGIEDAFREYLQDKSPNTTIFSKEKYHEYSSFLLKKLEDVMPAGISGPEKTAFCRKYSMVQNLYSLQGDVLYRKSDDKMKRVASTENAFDIIISEHEYIHRSGELRHHSLAVTCSLVRDVAYGIVDEDVKWVLRQFKKWQISKQTIKRPFPGPLDITSVKRFQSQPVPSPPGGNAMPFGDFSGPGMAPPPNVTPMPFGNVPTPGIFPQQTLNSVPFGNYGTPPMFPLQNVNSMSFGTFPSPGFLPPQNMMPPHNVVPQQSLMPQQNFMPPQNVNSIPYTSFQAPGMFPQQNMVSTPPSQFPLSRGFPQPVVAPPVQILPQNVRTNASVERVSTQQTPSSQAKTAKQSKIPQTSTTSTHENATVETSTTGHKATPTTGPSESDTGPTKPPQEPVATKESEKSQTSEMTHPESAGPGLFERIQVDLMPIRINGTSECNWVLFLRDHLSNLTMLHALKNKDHRKIAKYLDEFIEFHGPVSVIQYDPDPVIDAALARLSSEKGLKFQIGGKRGDDVSSLALCMKAAVGAKITRWKKHHEKKHWRKAIPFVESSINCEPSLEKPSVNAYVLAFGAQKAAHLQEVARRTAKGFDLGNTDLKECFGKTGLADELELTDNSKTALTSIAAKSKSASDPKPATKSDPNDGTHGQRDATKNVVIGMEIENTSSEGTRLPSRSLLEEHIKSRDRVMEGASPKRLYARIELPKEPHFYRVLTEFGELDSDVSYLDMNEVPKEKCPGFEKWFLHAQKKISMKEVGSKSNTSSSPSSRK
ncbi:hypothetical protein JCM33374_g4967 [Metschnikowia sp. JCM 33374]|nr:hypothetical protein JCM33374_g4967 [Metschnikowia sp. JCM 33374]